MSNTKIHKISELRTEKEKLEKLGKEQVREMKKGLTNVKNEGKHALINKVLIPVGVAVIAGYGLKKLIDNLSSDNEKSVPQNTPPGYVGDPPIYHRSEAPQNQKKGNSLLSNIDWTAMAVRVAPFILSVGKKMYEDGNLPFFDAPAKEDGVEES